MQGRVALITGAGGGLGRSHALYFASLGAKVLVNDLGESSNRRPAEETVELIRRSGGEAEADFHGVETMEGATAMVEAALGAFGRLDIVVNNAGILRDRSFAKQSERDWEDILSVHLTGSRNVTKAAWGIFCGQNYGRVVLTTSASGLYGNYGQSNYGAAKLGLVGFMNSLKEEGERYNIKINSIAPMARSRMTEGILPEEILERLDPRFVSPVVAYLSDESCAVQGQCWAVGAGSIARVAIVENDGCRFESGKDFGVKEIAAALESITDLKRAQPLPNLQAAALKLLQG